MARWFWIIGLSTGVLLFSGLALLGIVLAIKDRAPHWLASALFCSVFAYRAWEPLRVRIWGQNPAPPHLDIDF
jgi:uncharacterized membrane protein YbhN (UPF0104 family)